jgi:hypothetical protein
LHDDDNVVEEMMRAIEEILPQLSFDFPMKIQIGATLLLFRINPDTQELETKFFSSSSGNTRLFPQAISLFRARD